MAVIKSSRAGDYTAMAEDGVVTELPKNGGPHVVTKTFVKGPVSEEVDGIPEEETCGWGPFSPSLCQRFRNPKWVLFWLCWAGAIQVGVLSLSYALEMGQLLMLDFYSLSVSGDFVVCW